MRIKWCGIFLIILSLMSCKNGLSGNGQGGKEKSIYIVNWNVETFFDAVKDGCEYREFLASKTWGKKMYEDRLKRLCSVIKKLDADVFVMEELENEKILHDIFNFMSSEWRKTKSYSYGCFAKEPGSSIGCGILSKYELRNMSVHSIEVKSETSDQPSLRPLIKVDVKKGNSEVTLIVNHWKSMSGGAESTEKWRNWEEHVLCELAAECINNGKNIIALGDFNRDIDNFCLKGSDGIVNLRNISGGVQKNSGVEMKTVWYRNGILVEPGSYYYKGKWNRLDNFLYGGNVSLKSFSPETKGEWCDKSTCIPEGYKIWNGNGFSDHLPVGAEFYF